jgi:hypothetical protein
MPKSGMSINNIVFRKQNVIYCSDTLEFGIGGYNLASGVAWRFEIAINLCLRASLNSLELIACVITIRVDIVKNRISPEDCVLR